MACVWDKQLLKGQDGEVDQKTNNKYVFKQIQPKWRPMVHTAKRRSLLLTCIDSTKLLSAFPTFVTVNMTSPETRYCFACRDQYKQIYTNGHFVQNSQDKFRCYHWKLLEFNWLVYITYQYLHFMCRSLQRLVICSSGNELSIKCRQTCQDL